MDLKHKKKEAWVGNIYQKLEAVCHEVDNFVSKDTFKYVENQVQTVGESVTRFCSDVVQDLLPSSFTDSRTKSAKTSHQKLDDLTDSNTKSNIKTEDRHVNIADKQSSVELQDPVVLEEGHDENILVFEDTGKGIQGNVSAEVEEIVCKEKYHPQIIHFPKNENEASLLHLSNGEHCSNEIVDKVSSLNIAEFTPTIRACSNNDFHSGRFSDSRSSDLVFSYDSSESEAAEMKLISCSSSFSTESIHLSESTHTIPLELENNCYDRIDSFTCVSDMSSTKSYSEPVPDYPGPENDADMHLAFCDSVLSLESTDVGSSRISDCASADETYRNTHVLDCKCSLLEDLRASVEIDPSMEIIELSDKGKFNDSCMVADNKLLFSISCRTTRPRSYKKVIRDAFTSRKRLTKEYEQLGILYGDIDAESVEHPKQNPSLPVADMSITTKHPADENLCGSEWELL